MKIDCSENSKEIPTCYIPTLSFLHHCQVGKRHVQSCSLHQSSHCTKPRKPSRDSCEPGEDLAKASRTHFSVSDLFVIGCRHGKEWLSGSSLLGQSRFGRRNYRCGFACSGSVRMRVWLFAGADEFLIGCCRLFDRL